MIRVLAFLLVLLAIFLIYKGALLLLKRDVKQGIERLLREEFPQFENLIQVDPGPGHEAAMAAAHQ